MAPAFRPHHTAEQGPARLRQVESGRGLGRRPWSFALGGLQVWSVQTRVALPKIGRLTPGVARRQRPLIFPYTAESGVVLQVLTDPRQMPHHRGALWLQIDVV